MNVVVIGGGPAGMMSAISSAENGNNVILYKIYQVMVNFYIVLSKIIQIMI